MLAPIPGARATQGEAQHPHSDLNAKTQFADFQFDETATHRRLNLLNVIDEHTREALAIKVDHHISADTVVDVVAQIASKLGAPTHLRMDNGPELVAEALRDWCRLSGAHTAYIEPGAPWQNGHIESFNGRLRDECLNIENFANLLEARVVIEDWRTEYNHYRPHRSLGGRTPADYAKQHNHQHP